MPYGIRPLFCCLPWLIQLKLRSSYGNMEVATTKPKDGWKQLIGTWPAATNSLGPIVPRALQNVFERQLSVTSNDVNMHRHPGWSAFVLQIRRQRVMLCFSPLFIKVRSYIPCISSKATKNINPEKSIDTTLVSRFRGWRWVTHSWFSTPFDMSGYQLFGLSMTCWKLRTSTVRCCYWLRRSPINRRWKAFFLLC